MTTYHEMNALSGTAEPDDTPPYMDPEWEFSDDTCPNCGEYPTAYQRCTHCGGEGWIDGLDEIDPLWYGPDDTEPCLECNGHGAFKWCRKCGWDFFEKRCL